MISPGTALRAMMSCRRSSRVILLCGVLLTTGPFAYAEWQDSDVILGEWLVEAGDAKVEIYACGEALCGRVVWLQAPRYPADDDEGMGGREKVDRENPDKARRADPILGKTVLWDLEPSETGWGEGRLYDPETGTTYRCSVRLLTPRRLELRGYVGISLFGRTVVWTR